MAKTLYKAPKRLQFRLRHFLEHDSTDSGFQGGDDEVYMSALGFDSAVVVKGADGRPDVPMYIAPLIGDVTDNAVRGPWATNPFVLVDWDLHPPGGVTYPRTFTVVLLVVEQDNEGLADDFTHLIDKVGGKVREKVVEAATNAGDALATAVVGAAIPGIGPVVGAAVGGLAGDGYDALVAEIKAGLHNEVFTPVPITFSTGDHVLAGHEYSVHIQQFGAHYELGYEWHYVR
ncbi:hypothetical protein Cch01nite_18280 [Cellulomonas chitinilytica]|uniref:Uncharacterized protein n=1 Tax=Cellulomonas chitinilytica TaxID=398759 RepID=A0A919P4Z8_9CELL|nr:hypothetical protein [Cellulomonas chitinilytica]GIG21104.1 hypothetical protein Cch01nite_18280 [Cellulomonas chitinilytica]